MLDFLFRFSVLNTAFATIGKEIGDALSGLRREWHLCLAVWTMYFGMSELQNSWLEVGSVNALVFVFATCYIAFVEYVASKHKWLNFLDIELLVKISKLGMHISSPVVLWFYVWSPLNTAVTCVLKHCAGEKGGLFSPVVSVVLLLLVSVLVLYRKPENSEDPDGEAPQTAASSAAPGPSRRPPSARIRARREQQEK